MLRFGIGDIAIHRVIEQEAPFFDPFTFFPTLSKDVLDANRSWLEPVSLDPATGKLVLCIQSYVVKTPHHTILIDSCVGNDKPRPTHPFWANMTSDAYMRALGAAGFAPESIDYVLCTHMHVDHVGWNTRLENGRWVPTFPKARYVFSRKEHDYWTERTKTDPVPWIEDSVLPIMAAGRGDLVASDHALNDLVQFLPTPGHTPDHVAVLLGRGGRDAVVTGDLIHSPLQAVHPEISMRADFDPAQAAATRRSFLERCCETNTLACFAHFPSPSAGRISRRGEGFWFNPTSP